MSRLEALLVLRHIRDAYLVPSRQDIYANLTGQKRFYELFGTRLKVMDL